MTAAFHFIQPLSTDSQGRISSLSETPADFPRLLLSPTISPLTAKGVILVEGADTEKLLQGQLTCDISQLTTENALKGALCDVKGRMICSLACTRTHSGTTLLIMHKGLVDSTLTTLKKYAVFYKVTLSDVSNEYAVFGLQNRRFDGIPDLDISTAKITENLTLSICPAPKAETFWEGKIKDYQPCGESFWDYLMINNGEGDVHPETTNEFIPQMLNLQHTNGVNFRKGCYTGQEIVARMQYLGKLKRRMYHLHLDTEETISPGDTVDQEGKSGVGTVVNAVISAAGTNLLVVLTTDAAAAETLRIGNFNGSFHILPLPYDSQLTAAQK